MKILRIKPNEAALGMRTAEPVYGYTESGSRVYLAPKGTVIEENFMRFLANYRVERIGIVPQEITKTETPQTNTENVVYAQAKESATSTSLPKTKTLLNDEQRREAIGNIHQLFTAFSEPNVGGNMTTAYQVINRLDKVIGQLVAAISCDASGLVQINDLKTYDEYTYHHSLSVAMLSIATGQALKFSIPKLFRLGRCAMLHDVGKLSAPIEIISKNGKLTEKEFSIIQNHPVDDAMSIKNKGIGDLELWSGVMFHHEKINGTGYPKQLTGRDIPIFSRIIAVADVYDAVTSYRSYRSPMSPADAYELIMSGTGTDFEHDSVSAFARKIELYPVNTIVELSDKRRGIVVKSGNPALRPMVKVLPGNELLDLTASKNLNITIVKTFNPSGFSCDSAGVGDCQQIK